MKQLLLFFIAVFFSASLLNAQNAEAPSPIIFIYDASGSMWGKMEKATKKEIAAEVLSESVDKLPENQKIGLVAYGHRRKGDCEDVEFLVDMDNSAKTAVKQSIKDIVPLGKTPLAYSALQVIDQLRTTKTKATIILITDGIESCGGKLCDVIRAAKEEGIEFKLHVIGFGLKDDETEELKCAANAGDGQYYDAGDTDGLTEGLNEATNTTVDDPAGNFSVYAVKNGKPVDAYVKAFKAGTDENIKAVRTYGDTILFYLPPGQYDLSAKPLEGSDVDAVLVSGLESVADKITHQTVSFDGGKVKVMTLNNGEGWDATVKIYPRASKRSVAGGRTYGRADEYELNPGVYDIEVKALSLVGSQVTHRLENVQVVANETVEVEHNFESGVVMIGATSDAGLVDAVIGITDKSNNKKVGAGRTYTSAGSNPKKFILTPGAYEISLMALGDHKGKKETFTLVVKKGETVEKITRF